MLQIKHTTVEKEITIQSLFEDVLEFSLSNDKEYQTKNKVEIKTPEGYKSIQGYMTTEPLAKTKIVLETGKSLVAAQKHRVMTDTGWKFLRDIVLQESIETVNGLEKVISITQDDDEEFLYDVQVEDVHCFYSNGILSHNSHWLVQVGAAALKTGKTIVHYSFELSEVLVGKRYDAHLTGIDVNEILNHKQDVKDFYEANEMGSLIIKYYPTRTASVNTIRNHLEKLKFRGYFPSVVIIDYADVMRSTKAYEALRHELMLIYEELRQLAGDFNVPIWTASQSNRAGANADIVGLENMGEAYGKAQVSDFVLGLSRKPEEKDKGYGRLFVAKNRSGRDGMQFHVKIDTARSKFAKMDLQEVADIDPKNIMKQKWKEVQEAKKELDNG